MDKILTVIFRDIEGESDVKLRSIPGNKENLVLELPGSAPTVVSISELELAIGTVKEF